ncbi:hypothetical protein POM88_034454 [Heracleum sosnowskyi]|uniref:Uncharacterized protein n=1 Tax=Heracleum sosnowskyi TaxID=360622 RepID=A0AAD8HJA1_9APIA|nr:hypothetical protein POM88_034454 [Heracleum sosnowskyi]
MSTFQSLFGFDFKVGCVFFELQTLIVYCDLQSIKRIKRDSLLGDAILKVLGHMMLSSILWICAKSVDLDSKVAITAFYMFIWKNPGMFPPSAQVAPSTARNALKEPISRKTVRPKTLDIQSSSDSSGRMKFTEGPLRNDNVSRQSGIGSTNQNRAGSGSGSGRPRKQNAGSEHSVDQSPLDPQYQAKLIGKGSGSAWD